MKIVWVFLLLLLCIVFGGSTRNNFYSHGKLHPLRPISFNISKALNIFDPTTIGIIVTLTQAINGYLTAYAALIQGPCNATDPAQYNSNLQSVLNFYSVDFINYTAIGEEPLIVIGYQGLPGFYADLKEGFINGVTEDSATNIFIIPLGIDEYGRIIAQATFLTTEYISGSLGGNSFVGIISDFYNQTIWALESTETGYQWRLLLVMVVDKIIYAPLNQLFVETTPGSQCSPFAAPDECPACPLLQKSKFNRFPHKCYHK